ncbi:hypothetical protein PghCCS26_12960 [Paenibacillus glycanilyticus]|uniref:DUF3916 domain-containing protein n=1 Tax=Paenibacillus glycanilyticus TaxID=126569 RepID=A0ABQ6NHF5_9BACL|nr:hypothetical protein [Paenibacillus glycanilyticus]GMK44169.1 hypothetical protein PghCCS26_12960 [Paenibacillus glycanilyticus]
MYLRTKNKIRGWKRRIRHIEQWKQRNIVLDMNTLAAFRRDYAKLWIPLFYSLVRRTPPIWYNRLLLDAMIEVYNSWHETLTKTGEPFYLKIWLFEPEFINSQVVAAYRDELDFYDNAFESVAEIIPFPFPKLEQFNWLPHFDPNHYREEDSEGIAKKERYVWIGSML